MTLQAEPEKVEAVFEGSLQNISSRNVLDGIDDLAKDLA